MRKAKARDQASRACAPSKGRPHKTPVPIPRKSPQAAGLGPVRSASKSPKQHPLRRKTSGSARSKDAAEAAALESLGKPGQAAGSQPGAGAGLLLSLSLPSISDSSAQASSERSRSQPHTSPADSPWLPPEQRDHHQWPSSARRGGNEPTPIDSRLPPSLLGHVQHLMSDCRRE